MFINFTKKKQLLFLVCALIVILIIGFFSFNQPFKVDEFTNLISTLSIFVETKPVLSFFLFALFYIAVCSVPFPFISLITLGIGYLLGFTYGLIITSFGSALGGLILFLFSRRFLSELLITRLVNRFPSVKPMLTSNDFLIAASIRFIPGMPFFLPSVLLSMTKLSALKFYLSTQLGLLITMIVFINAGSTLSDLNSINANLFSPKLILSMLLLALLPLLFKVIHKRKDP